MEVPEIDPNFEPQQRARSNTWPLRPKEFKEEGNKTPTNEGENAETAIKDPLGLKQQKTSSRRNAWGNLSYADLITKAIQNSPEQRLTLSQIYDWMVQNVPYFKDKGDSNSSAGWKNSIRHNLSLHNRFMRIQNEGAGKSSWWVINPDAKPGKSPRRRATSMDTKAYEKKRGRVKKKVEQMRAALEAHGHHSPSGGSDYGDDMGYGDAFNLSPQDFRARTSSNASSIGGRLSPIQSAFEPDLHDNQVPPMSPIPWTQKTGVSQSYSGQDGFTETLSESLAEMFVGEQLNALSPGNNLMNEQALSGSTLSTPSPLPTQLSPVNTNNLNFQEQNTLMPAPPPYPDTMRQSPLSQQHSPQQVGNIKGGLSPEMGNGGMNSGLEGMMGHTQSGYMAQSLTELLQGDNSGYGGDSVLQQDPMMSGSNGISTTMGMTQFSMNGGSAFQNTQNLRALQQQIRPPQGLMTAQQRAQLSSLNNSLLRQALTQKQQQNTLQQQQQQHQQQQQQQSFSAPQQQGGVQSTLAQMLAGNHNMGMTPNAMQSMPANSQQQGLPYDLDLNLTDFQTNEFDCDVDQIINQELKIDGELDFNFDGIQQSNGSGDGTIRTSCN